MSLVASNALGTVHTQLPTLGIISTPAVGAPIVGMACARARSPERVQPPAVLVRGRRPRGASQPTP